MRVAAHDGRNGIRGARDQATFENDEIRWEPLDGCFQVLEVVNLCNHPDVVFQGKDLAYADTVNGLRIRKNDADDVRLGRWTGLGRNVGNGLVEHVGLGCAHINSTD